MNDGVPTESNTGQEREGKSGSVGLTPSNELSIKYIQSLQLDTEEKKRNGENYINSEISGSLINGFG